MRKIERDEVKDLVEYERAREGMRAHVIAVKQHRRVGLGESLSLLFENRETVLFQIQEMIRTERLVDDDKIRAELDAYNALIPMAGQLSATLFIEIPELARMSNQQVRRLVGRFLGLDRQAVWIRIGRHAVPAEFEPGHSNEEKMAAVHYLRFSLPPEARAALADEAEPARLVVEHANYAAEAVVGPALRKELLADLE